MRASFDGLAWLHQIRERVRAVTELAGLDRLARERSVHAVHEASVLACQVVDDAVAERAAGHGGRDDLMCRIDASVTETSLRAVILLPHRTHLRPARRGEDSLRFVRVFSDEACWSGGPGHRGLLVVVHAERGAVHAAR